MQPLPNGLPVSPLLRTSAIVAITWFTLAGVWFARGARADGERVFQLWNPAGEFHPNYDVIVARLRTGDVIELKPGKQVTIQGQLGQGTTTRIFRIGDGKAIRLAKSTDLLPGGTYCPAFLDYYYTGAQRLADTGVAMVKVLLGESDPRHYVIVQEESVKFTLGDLLSKRVVNPQAMGELPEFAKTTWRLRMVGDMHVDQIAYTGEGWKLLDFNASVKFATSPRDATLFSYMRGLPLRLKFSLSHAVQNERGARSSWNASRLQEIIAELRRNAVPFYRF